MRLVACASCHTQFDVTSYHRSALRCHCGMLILIAAPPQGRTVPIARCGHCGAPWVERADRCEYCGGLLDKAANLTLICPECYARNPDSSRFCRGCGVAFQPEPVHFEESREPCPRCSKPDSPAMLERRELRGSLVGECHGCHGMWVGRETFEKLMNRTEEQTKLLPGEPGASAPPHEPVVYAHCPRCSAMMQRRNFKIVSGVIIDQCVKHGVWLDADELERIAHFLASGGLIAAEAREREEQQIQLEAERESRIRTHQDRVLQNVSPLTTLASWLMGDP